MSIVGDELKLVVNLIDHRIQELRSKNSVHPPEEVIAEIITLTKFRMKIMEWKEEDKRERATFK